MTSMALKTSRRLAGCCFAALALLLTQPGCALLGGKSGSSSLAGAPVSFYSQAGQTTGPSVAEFKVGQPIYAVVTLEEPASNLLGGDGNVPVSVYVGENSWGGIRLPLTDAQKSGKVIEFAIISEDMQKQAEPSSKLRNTAESLMNWLNKQPRGVQEVIVFVGSTRQGAGSFKLDLSAGADGYAAMVAANEKLIDDSTADTPIPTAAMTDAKLEQKLMAILKQDHPKLKYYKVIITSNDWSMTRHEVTGVILGRSLYIAALSQSSETGQCAISTGLIIREEHQGGGKFGNTIQAPGGSSVNVPCDRFATFGPPK